MQKYFMIWIVLHDCQLRKTAASSITNSGLHYIVMEFIDGLPISEWFPDTTTNLKNKLSLFCELCDVVNYAHRMQVIHGDLKPDNILMTAEHKIKVLDFGISQLIKNDDSTSNELAISASTKDYASPELISGGKASIYSDIFALGKILHKFILLTKLLKKSQRIELNSIANKATAFDINERYASVLELKSDLTRFITGHVALSYQASTWYRLNKFVFKRHPLSVMSGALFSVAMCILIANIAYQHVELTKAKYQSDLMLEKFSLVLDLDLDSKSNVELALADNYASRNEYTKSLRIYKNVIDRFDQLKDKDIAFHAGIQFLQQIFDSKQYELKGNNLDALVDNLEFIPNINLPVNATQAFFYHYYLDSQYSRGISDEKELYDTHTQLLLDIKKTYWDELNDRRGGILWSLNLGQEEPEVEYADVSFYSEQVSSENMMNLGIFELKNRITKQLKQWVGITESSQSKVEKQPLHRFLESSDIFAVSTNSRYASYHNLSAASFKNGLMKFTDESGGIYSIVDNTITIDFGTGKATDEFVYLSSKIALIIVGDYLHDLKVLSYVDLTKISTEHHWSIDELADNDWYHIYDSALVQEEKVIPSMVEMEFSSKDVVLTHNGVEAITPWEINDNYLVFNFAKTNYRPENIKFTKRYADNNLLIVQNTDTQVLSIFIKNKLLAKKIYSRWKELL